jgi:hypothetical protein
MLRIGYGRPRGEMISERERGRESEEMKKEGGSG